MDEVNANGGFAPYFAVFSFVSTTVYYYSTH